MIPPPLPMGRGSIRLAPRVLPRRGQAAISCGSTAALQTGSPQTQESLCSEAMLSSITARHIPIITSILVHSPQLNTVQHGAARHGTTGDRTGQDSKGSWESRLPQHANAWLPCAHGPVGCLRPVTLGGANLLTNTSSRAWAFAKRVPDPETWNLPHSKNYFDGRRGPAMSEIELYICGQCQHSANNSSLLPYVPVCRVARASPRTRSEHEAQNPSCTSRRVLIHGAP